MLGEKQPFRITIEQYNQKVSVEVDHSDVSIEQVTDLVAQALMGAGWSEDQAERILGSAKEPVLKCSVCGDIDDDIMYSTTDFNLYCAEHMPQVKKVDS